MIYVRSSFVHNLKLKNPPEFPSTPIAEDTRSLRDRMTPTITLEVEDTFKTPEPTLVSSAGNTSNEKSSPEPETPEVKKTFGKKSTPNAIPPIASFF